LSPHNEGWMSASSSSNKLNRDISHPSSVS
jgi:hypothetical protein